MKPGRRPGRAADREGADKRDRVYPPSHKTTAVRPCMNTKGGPSPRLTERPTFAAEAAASAESAEEMKDFTAVMRGGFMQRLATERWLYQAMLPKMCQAKKQK